MFIPYLTRDGTHLFIGIVLSMSRHKHFRQRAYSYDEGNMPGFSYTSMCPVFERSANMVGYASDFEYEDEWYEDPMSPSMRESASAPVYRMIKTR